MSWRERYKNNEARFDHHIKTFQYKNKLSKQAVPMGSAAMLANGMEDLGDLDDFGTDDEEEDQRPRGKRAARVDSDEEDGDRGPARVRSRPVSRSVVAPEQPTSKRKRVSDASDRTSKRTRVILSGSSGEMEGESPTNGPTGEKEGDAMDQDSQGEETLEVEQNLFCASDEDSLAIPRYVTPFSHPFRIFHLYVDRTATPMGIVHQHGPPDRPGPGVQWRLLPRTSVPPNGYTDHTARKILPPALSQRLTSMKPTRTCRSSLSAFGNEQSRRSLKVRLVGTNNLALFAHLKFVLVRHQNLTFLSRDVRLGKKLERLGKLKLIKLRTI